MIIDCFPFFNELDLLELRLNELDSVVDRFVLVEAARTFQNQPKKYYFEENKQRYAKFLHKIEHVKVERFPKFNFKKFRKTKPWDFDNYQKNQVAIGLNRLSIAPDDVIIISDLDEIPKAELVEKYAKVPGAKVFHLFFSYYYFNCVTTQCPKGNNLYVKDNVGYWKGPVMVDYKDFVSFQKTRCLHDLPDDQVVPVHKGGWHFSLMGKPSDIFYKLQSWAHAKEKHYSTEHLKDLNNLQHIIESGEDLFGRDFKFKIYEFNDCFPSYAVKNPSIFDAMIFKGGTGSLPK